MSQLRMLGVKNYFYCQMGMILLLWSCLYDKTNVFGVCFFFYECVPLCDHA